MRPILLASFLQVASLGWSQDNPNYGPDFNGDGCYSIAEKLGILPFFGVFDVWTCGDPVNFDGMTAARNKKSSIHYLNGLFSSSFDHFN